MTLEARAWNLPDGSLQVEIARQTSGSHFVVQTKEALMTVPARASPSCASPGARASRSPRAAC